MDERIDRQTEGHKCLFCTVCGGGLNINFCYYIPKTNYYLTEFASLTLLYSICKYLDILGVKFKAVSCVIVAERHRSLTPDWMHNIPRRLTSYVAFVVYEICCLCYMLYISQACYQ